jgi:hypothetical protein
VIGSDPAPTSVQAAIATSARRARIFAGLQSVALITIVFVGTRWGCGDPPAVAGDAADPEPDAGAGGDFDARIAMEPDAPAGDAALLGCLDVAGCRAACESSGGRLADACVRWADLLRAPHGSNARRNRIGARDVYRRTCLLTGDALACTRLALAAGFLHDLDLAPDWIDPERAPLGMLAGACTEDRDRGELACAAVELLAPTSALARERRSARCPGDDDARAGCAAEIALEACRGNDAEACYLAAREGLATSTEARDRLGKLCAEEDRPACLYLFALSPPRAPDRKSLVAACSLGDQKDESIASACLARTLIKDPDPRPARFAEFACELGSCQDPRMNRPLPVVLKRSCEAGHVNGCANLIYVNRASPGAWKPIVDELNRRAPPYLRPVSANREADEVACELGALDGCRAASRRLAATDPARAARLEAFRRRLESPLAVP